MCAQRPQLGQKVLSIQGSYADILSHLFPSLLLLYSCTCKSNLHCRSCQRALNRLGIDEQLVSRVYFSFYHSHKNQTTKKNTTWISAGQEIQHLGLIKTQSFSYVYALVPAIPIHIKPGIYISISRSLPCITLKPLEILLAPPTCIGVPYHRKLPTALWNLLPLREVETPPMRTVGCSCCRLLYLQNQKKGFKILTKLTWTSCKLVKFPSEWSFKRALTV